MTNEDVPKKGRIRSFWSEATTFVKAVTGLLLAIPPVVAATFGIVAYLSTGHIPRQSEPTTEDAPDPERPPEGEVFHREKEHWDQERD